MIPTTVSDGSRTSTRIGTVADCETNCLMKLMLTVFAMIFLMLKMKSKVKAKTPAKREKPNASKPTKKLNTAAKKATALPVLPSLEKSTSLEPVSVPSPKQPPEPIPGTITVLYNHYNTRFPISDSVLDAALINEKYAFEFVFKGDYQLVFTLEEDVHVNTTDENNDTDNSSKSTSIQKLERFKFTGFQDGKTYRVAVELDPEEEKRLNTREPGTYGIKHYSNNNNSNSKKTTNSDLITRELQGMSLAQLEEKGERYKELIEARELEDVLYG